MRCFTGLEDPHGRQALSRGLGGDDPAHASTECRQWAWQLVAAHGLLLSLGLCGEIGWRVRDETHRPRRAGRS